MAQLVGEGAMFCNKLWVEGEQFPLARKRILLRLPGVFV